jgi:ribosomal protein S18 acetylase RimI-like enzyme
MLNFVISKTREKKLSSVELNVNKNNDAIFAYEKLGFQIVRTECNDIGEGFYMDDYVYSLNV